MHLNWLLGVLGGVAFGWAAVPAAVATAKARRSIGTPLSVILSITLGTLLMYAYLVIEYGFNWVITVNYSVEFASWAVLLWFHFFPANSPGLTKANR